jgi:NADH-quinone oxidoreductase subunit M
VLLTILFGVYPKPVMDVTAASVNKLIADYNQDIEAAQRAQLAVAEDK